LLVHLILSVHDHPKTALHDEVANRDVMQLLVPPSHSVNHRARPWGGHHPKQMSTGAGIDPSQATALLCAERNARAALGRSVAVIEKRY